MGDGSFFNNETAVIAVTDASAGMKSADGETKIVIVFSRRTFSPPFIYLSQIHNSKTMYLLVAKNCLSGIRSLWWLTGWNLCVPFVKWWIFFVEKSGFLGRLHSISSARNSCLKNLVVSNDAWGILSFDYIFLLDLPMIFW